MKKELVQNCPIPRLTFLSNSILPFTIALFTIQIIGFSYYNSILNFWKNFTSNSYDFNVVVVDNSYYNSEMLEKLQLDKHVRDVFTYTEHSAFATFNDFINENTDGSVGLIGTIPNTKKILYGQDLVEAGDIICPSTFFPDSLINSKKYNSNKTIDLKKYLNNNLDINFIGLDNAQESLKLVGIFDASYDYSEPNVCYVTHETLKNLNKKYQSKLNDSNFPIFILLDNITNADEILSNLGIISYMPMKTIKTEVGTKVLNIISGSSIVLISLLFLFCYIINNRKITKEYQNIGIFKIVGYTDKQIKKIIYCENILIVIISFIFSILVSLFILYNFNNWFLKYDSVLSMMPIKANVYVIILSLIFIILITLLSTTFSLKKINNLEVNEIVHE